MRALLVFLAACAPVAHPVVDAPDELPPDQLRYFAIFLGGARVGTATESEHWTRAGVALHRVELMRFYRGDAPVQLETTIDIAADRALIPRRVEHTERGAEEHHTVLEAIPPGAIPAELAPLYVRRDGKFDGTVFLPARGFASGKGHIERVAPRRLVARLTFEHATAEATIDLDRDGTYARVVDGEGVIATRISAAQAQLPFEPVDLIAATSLPLTGRATHRLILDGEIALPPVPGQAASSEDGEVVVELAPRLPGALPDGDAGADRTGEIRQLVAGVRGRIDPDLGAAHTVADATATKGDCTTFALAYAALATDRGIPTRVVTGLRVDGARLVRHRWAVSWTGRAWIAVDAAYGAAPAGGDLVGLAVHDADDAGLVAGEAALTAIRSARWK